MSPKCPGYCIIPAFRTGRTEEEPADPMTSDTKRSGVLLVNLGSPDSPGTGDVRRYLREFLWDHRVIDGAPAAEFLAEIRDLLSSPVRLLA